MYKNYFEISFSSLPESSMTQTKVMKPRLPEWQRMRWGGTPDP